MPAGQPLLTTQTHVGVDVAVLPGATDGIRIKSLELSVPGGSGKIVPSGAAGSASTAKLELNVSHPLPATRPYFSRPSLEQPFYDISELSRTGHYPHRPRDARR